MPIDEKTAQLILDAIAWCNRDWLDALDQKHSFADDLAMARGDFKRFCDERGITEVIRVVRQ